MKTFRCTSCGVEIQRETMPLKCPQCQRQAIGLFRLVPPGASPAGAGSPPPGYPPRPAGVTPLAAPQPPGKAGAPVRPQPSTGLPARSGVPAGAVPASPMTSAYGSPIPPVPAVPGHRPAGISPPPVAATPVPPPVTPPIPVAATVVAPPPASPIPPLPPAPSLSTASQPPPLPLVPASAAPPVVAPPVVPTPCPPPLTQATQAATGRADSAPPSQAPQPIARKHLPPAKRPVENGNRAATATPAARNDPRMNPLPKPRPEPEPPPVSPESGSPSVRRPAATPDKPVTARPAAGPGAASPSAAPQPAAPTARAAASAVARPSVPQPAPRVRPKTIRPPQFVWAFPEEPPFAEQAVAMRTPPAVDAAGRLYVCTQGKLFALEESNRAVRVAWDYVVGSHVPGRVVQGPDGHLRVHSGDGRLHCVSTEGKQVFPPVTVGQPLGWAAPVVDRNDTTWISAFDGGLLRVTPEGKTDPRRYFRSRAKLDSAGVIRDEVFYLGSEEGYVLALSLAGPSGRNLWNQAAEAGYAGGFVNSSPAVTAAGTLVVAAREEVILGFAPDGQVAWKLHVPGQMLASPVLDAQGHIYVGVSQCPRGAPAKGMLVSIDGNSRKIRWQAPAQDAVESTPVIGDDGVVYFGDNAGVIRAVGPDGDVRWSAQVESPVRSAGTIFAPHRVAFGTDNDTLVVLECSSTALAPGWPKLAGTLGQSGCMKISP